MADGFRTYRMGCWTENTGKVQLLLDFVLPHLCLSRGIVSDQQTNVEPPAAQRSALSHRPLIIGISGLQGSGKSTIAALLANALGHHGFLTRVISLDDFYKTFEERQELQTEHPQNALLKVRGQPGTHDLPLANAWIRQFETLESPGSTRGDLGYTMIWPSFDKSLKEGQGDRARTHTIDCQRARIACILLEGWCVGFQALERREIETRYLAAACEDVQRRGVPSTLPKHSIEDLHFVNDRLRDYNEAFLGPGHLDLLIHLDAEDLRYVYDWRLEQEQELRQRCLGGMSDEEVVEFVDKYMPAYELYLPGLKRCFFPRLGAESDGSRARHLRIVNNIARHFVLAEVM